LVGCSFENSNNGAAVLPSTLHRLLSSLSEQGRNEKQKDTRTHILLSHDEEKKYTNQPAATNSHNRQTVLDSTGTHLLPCQKVNQPTNQQTTTHSDTDSRTITYNNSWHNKNISHHSRHSKSHNHLNSSTADGCSDSSIFSSVYTASASFGPSLSTSSSNSSTNF